MRAEVGPWFASVLVPRGDHRWTVRRWPSVSQDTSSPDTCPVADLTVD